MSRPLSTRLDDIARTLRCHVASQQPPNLDTCAGLFALLQEMAREALALEKRARTADELEAVARDLDLVAHAKSGEIGRADLRAVVHPLDRAQLQAEHRKAQAAIDANERRIDALRAREAEIAGNRAGKQNSCGNDVLQFPVRHRTHRLQVITTCGGPDDGDAA